MRLRDMTTDIVISLPFYMKFQGLRVALPASVPRPVKLTRNRRNGPSPPAHVRVMGGAINEEDRDYIARKLGMKLGKFGSSIERITVRLSDTNGPKGGRDRRCQIKVVLSGLPSVVVNETDSTRHAPSTARLMRSQSRYDDGFSGVGWLTREAT